MEQKYPYYREILINQIHEDHDQPRRDFGTDGDENRLLLSIKQHGILTPINVSEIEKDTFYKALDGHRRYRCANKLKYKTMFCVVWPKMSKGAFETLRYEMQNNRRPWRPVERSEALAQIKEAMNFSKNRELADYLRISETVVANSLQLRKQKIDYLGAMERYGLSESYQTEFIRLKPKIRKIREFEVGSIFKIIFQKIQNKVIRNAKDFRKLGRIFMRATANEAEIYEFLSNPDMTVDELDQRSVQSGFSLVIEQAIQHVVSKQKNGIAFSSKETDLLKQFSLLLNKIL
ncbi:MAG: ParB/RepB/Spo0J family partition protein [Patescibacteria group bacterium]